MSIRVIFAAIFVITLSVHAWRRSWFVSACGAILMMAVNEHPDMPKSIAGVPGLNLWNVLMGKELEFLCGEGAVASEGVVAHDWGEGFVYFSAAEARARGLVGA